MKLNHFLALGFLFFAAILRGQDSTAFANEMRLFIQTTNIRFQQLDATRQQDAERIRLLEAENKRLLAENQQTSSMLYAADLAEYQEIRNEIRYVFSKADRLDADVENGILRFETHSLFNDLLQANNPQSSVLGFRFNKVLEDAALASFAKINDKDPKKRFTEDDQKRFKAVVNNVLSNPFVSTVIQTNPIASMASTIVSVAVNFTTNNSKSLENNAVDAQAIENFKRKLDGYIQFYDKLLMTSMRYQMGLDRVKNKYDFLNKSKKGFMQQLKTDLGINSDNYLYELDRILPEKPSKPRELMMSQQVRKAMETARKYQALRQQTDDFIYECNMLFRDFLTENINVLQTARTLPDQNNISQAKVDELIKRIEQFQKRNWQDMQIKMNE